MRDVDEARETIPGTIRLDRATGFPLATQEEAVLELIRAYLQLPYSVAEHGCGKKTSLILDQLVRMGVPIWAMRRGMILEHDMSPEALAQHDPQHRPHRLLVNNPLCALGDLSEPTLRAMLDEANTDVHLRERAIVAGPYRLHYEPTVQFLIARSRRPGYRRAVARGARGPRAQADRRRARIDRRSRDLELLQQRQRTGAAGPARRPRSPPAA